MDARARFRAGVRALVLGAALTLIVGADAHAYPFAGTKTAFAVGAKPLDVVTGDFDGDGKRDVATADLSGTLTLLKGNGEGGFVPLQSVVASSTGFTQVPQLAAADFNGDGRTDLALAGGQQGFFTLLSGAAGSPHVLSSNALIGQPTLVTAGNFVAGGGTDLAVGGFSSSVTVLEGSTGGGFSVHSSGTVPVDDPNSDFVEDEPVYIRDLVTANLDRSGTDDVGFAASQLRRPQGGVARVLAFGQGFTTAAGGLSLFGNRAAAGALIGNLRAVAVTGEGGDDDLAAVAGAGTLARLTNDSTSLTNGGTTSWGGSGGLALGTADFNGDSSPDFAVTTTGNQVYAVPSGGTPAGLATGSRPEAVAFADFDGDGKPDLVTADRDDNAVNVRLHASDATLGSAPTSLAFDPRRLDEGASDVKTAVLTNQAVAGSVTFTGLQKTGTDPGAFELLSGQTGDCATTTPLGPGETCNVRVRFAPASTGSKSASVTVGSNAPSLSIPLSGRAQNHSLIIRYPGTFTHVPTNINVGPTVGGEGRFTEIVNNGDDPVTIQTIETTGDSAFAPISFGNPGECTQGQVLAPGAECQATTSFDPSEVKQYAGQLKVTTDHAGTLIRELRGEGTLAAVAAPEAATAAAEVGEGQGITAVKVDNTGNEPLIVESISGLSGLYARVSPQAGDCVQHSDDGEENPRIVPVGGSCNVRVGFTADRLGDFAAQDLEVTVRPKNSSLNLKTTTTVTGRGVTSKISADKSSLAFDPRDLTSGAGDAQAVTVTNESSDPMKIDSIQPGSQFRVLAGQSGDCAVGDSIAKDATCALRVAFDPDTAGDHSQTVEVDAHTATKALSTSTTVTGTGVRSSMSVDQSTLDFGPQELADGAPAPKTVTVSNDGSAAVTLDTLTPGSQFHLLTGEAGDCGAGSVLAVGQTCKARVAFEPDPAGTYSESLGIQGHTSVKALSASTTLTGTSVRSAISVDSASLNLGAKPLTAGPTAPQTIAVRNAGTGPMRIDAVGAGSQFRVLSGSAGDCVGGVTVAAGATCAVRVTFDPDTAGPWFQSVRVDARTSTRTLAATTEVVGFGYAPPASPSGTTPRDSVRPRLSGLSVNRGRIGFRLSEPARVVFALQRCTKADRRKRCTRWTLLKQKFSVNGRQGANRAKLPSRIAGKKLRRGRYRLNGAAVDAASNASGLARREFRLSG